MLGTETSENSSELNSEKESDVVSDTDDRQVLKGKDLSASQCHTKKLHANNNGEWILKVFKMFVARINLETVCAIYDI